jgi:hypothetical protein
MKKLTSLLACLAVLSTVFSGCASIPAGSDAKATIAAIRPQIEVVRAILRPLISVFAQKEGRSAEEVNAVFAVIDPAITAALDDGSFAAMLDAVSWESERAKAIDKIATAMTRAKLNGVQIFPNHDANAATIAPFLDSLAVQVRALAHAAPAAAASSGGAS